MKSKIVLIFLIITSFSFANLDLSLQNEIEHSIKSGLQWLTDQQNEDGSWEHYPAITALSVTAILRSNLGISSDFEPAKKGLTFIENCAKSDGSIHIGDLPNYNTSICLIALKEADDPKFEELIDKAEKYLLSIQLDESEGYTPDSLYYGGIGYDGSDNRPDMSNLQWVIESFLEKETSQYAVENPLPKEIKNKEAKKLFYDKALEFMKKCQNLKEYNPMDYSGNDGGFIYEVGKSKAGETKSYGSMTYIGLKSMIYAQVNKNDPRVQAAYNWIKQHFIVETTPKMGNQGLFYYYQTMAKALRAYGEDVIIDENGKSHSWRVELANQIIKVQNEEGWWQNENGRWRENNKVLVTTYCVLSLEEILRN
ncbi:MAG TPA: hypothetical protein ENL20_00240 [Candidatus Cloacimonetes bacterium]|nr:hypothetical protein [Candidatus Cloacimonadota bacterium]